MVDSEIQDDTLATPYSLPLTWKYLDEPPERCPQCLGNLVQLPWGYRCLACDYRWVPPTEKLA